jgi:thiol-disulfide isomerase/thioredoxin
MAVTLAGQTARAVHRHRIMMRSWPGWFLLLGAIVGAARASDEASLKFEQNLASIVATPEVTVVHFWAPWCSNCMAEMKPDGWAKFLTEHPSVKVVFIALWHKGQDPAPKLVAAGLGGQPNLVTLTHPNPARKAGERVDALLGVPISWIPTTWVFKDGKLRYALNYGEIRFPILQQMVKDAAADW